MNIDLSIWLGIILVILLSINKFLVWYLKKLVKKLLFVSENLSDLVQIINNYKKHLKEVYSMEMFYGDETLKFLMSHTNSLLEILKDYEDIYNIAVPIEPEGEQSIDNEADPTTEDPTEEETPPPQIDQENVFYAGARKGNN